MNDTLVVIGEALIDFTPTEQGVALKDVSSFTKHCGGAPINIAAAAAKLGAHSKVLTQVGADAFGDFIWMKKEIETSLFTATPARIYISVLKILLSPRFRIAVFFIFVLWIWWIPL